MNSPLEKIVNGVLETNPDSIVAGTSANFTDYPSLTNRVHTAVFSLYHRIPYYDHPGSSEKYLRGSYPIIKISSQKEIVVEREGNFSLNYLKSQLV